MKSLPVRYFAGTLLPFVMLCGAVRADAPKRVLPRTLVISQCQFYPLREQERGYLGRYVDQPLFIGDRLCFEDMAIYSMVKNNTFNGMPLPEIGILRTDGSYETVKTFGYSDFKERLS